MPSPAVETAPPAVSVSFPSTANPATSPVKARLRKENGVSSVMREPAATVAFSPPPVRSGSVPPQFAAFETASSGAAPAVHVPEDTTRFRTTSEPVEVSHEAVVYVPSASLSPSTYSFDTVTVIPFGMATFEVDETRSTVFSAENGEVAVEANESFPLPSTVTSSAPANAPGTVLLMFRVPAVPTVTCFMFGKVCASKSVAVPAVTVRSPVVGQVRFLNDWVFPGMFTTMDTSSMNWQYVPPPLPASVKVAGPPVE